MDRFEPVIKSFKTTKRLYSVLKKLHFCFNLTMKCAFILQTLSRTIHLKQYLLNMRVDRSLNTLEVV